MPRGVMHGAWWCLRSWCTTNPRNNDPANLEALCWVCHGEEMAAELAFRSLYNGEAAREAHSISLSSCLGFPFSPLTVNKNPPVQHMDRGDCTQLASSPLEELRHFYGLKRAVARRHGSL